MMRLGCIRSWLRSRRGGKEGVDDDEDCDAEEYFALRQLRIQRKLEHARAENEKRWVDLKKAVISDLIVPSSGAPCGSSSSSSATSSSTSSRQTHLLPALTDAVDARELRRTSQILSELHRPELLQEVQTAEGRVAVWTRIDASVKMIRDAFEEGLPGFDAWAAVEPWIKFGEDKLLAAGVAGTAHAKRGVAGAPANPNAKVDHPYPPPPSNANSERKLRWRLDRLLNLEVGGEEVDVEPSSSSEAGGQAKAKRPGNVPSVRLSSTKTTSTLLLNGHEENARPSSSASRRRASSRNKTSPALDEEKTSAKNANKGEKRGAGDRSRSRDAWKKASPKDVDLESSNGTNFIQDDDDDDEDDVPYTARSNRSNVYEVLENEKRFQGIRIAEALGTNPHPDVDKSKSKKQRPQSAGLFAFRRFLPATGASRAAAEEQLGPGQSYADAPPPDDNAAASPPPADKYPNPQRRPAKPPPAPDHLKEGRSAVFSGRPPKDPRSSAAGGQQAPSSASYSSNLPHHGKHGEHFAGAATPFAFKQNGASGAGATSSDRRRSSPVLSSPSPEDADEVGGGGGAASSPDVPHQQDATSGKNKSKQRTSTLHTANVDAERAVVGRTVAGNADVLAYQRREDECEGIPTRGPPSRTLHEPENVPDTTRTPKRCSSKVRSSSQQSYRASAQRDYVASEYDQYYHQRSSQYQEQMRRARAQSANNFRGSRQHQQHGESSSSSSAGAEHQPQPRPSSSGGYRREYTGNKNPEYYYHSYGQNPPGPDGGAPPNNQKQYNEHVPRFAQQQMPAGGGGPRAPDSARSGGGSGGGNSARSQHHPSFGDANMPAWFRHEFDRAQEQRREEYMREQRAQAERARKANAERERHRYEEAETARRAREKRKAKEFHPDRPHNHGEKQALAGEMFKKAKEAYDRLLADNSEQEAYAKPPPQRSYSMNPNRGNQGFRI
eukprot:g12187.t1